MSTKEEEEEEDALTVAKLNAFGTSETNTTSTTRGDVENEFLSSRFPEDIPVATPIRVEEAQPIPEITTIRATEIEPDEEKEEHGEDERENMEQKEEDREVTDHSNAQETKRSPEESERERTNVKMRENGGDLADILRNVNVFKMKQIFKLKQHYTDWRVDNYFRVFDGETGRRMFEVQESTARCSRVCCFGRKTLIRVGRSADRVSEDGLRGDALYMRRPYRMSAFGLCRPRLDVFSIPSSNDDPDRPLEKRGVAIGAVICPLMMTSVGVDVYATTGEFIYQIRGQRCQAGVCCSYVSGPCAMFKRAHFIVHKVVDGIVRDHPCGKIVKFLRSSRNKGRWPFIKDQNISANTFYLDLGSANFEPLVDEESSEITNEMNIAERKALLMAAVFLLDALYFPVTRTKPWGKRIMPLGHIEHGVTWHEGRLREETTASLE